MSDASPTPTSGTGRASAATGGTAVISDPNGIPPAGEEIHLPGGSFIPVGIAIAITLVLVGTTTSWLWTIIGGIAFAVTLGMWIRDTRNEVAHLPDELGSPAAHH